MSHVLKILWDSADKNKGQVMETIKKQLQISWDNVQKMPWQNTAYTNNKKKSKKTHMKSAVLAH